MEVRREDQEKINKFSSLHQKETNLEEELRAKIVSAARHATTLLLALHYIPRTGSSTPKLPALLLLQRQGRVEMQTFFG